MDAKYLTKTSLLALLRGELRQDTAREVAGRIGVSEGFLGDVMKGRKPIGKRIPRHYGYSPVVVYEWALRKPKSQERKPGRAPSG